LRHRALDLKGVFFFAITKISTQRQAKA